MRRLLGYLSLGCAFAFPFSMLLHADPQTCCGLLATAVVGGFAVACTLWEEP